MVPRVTMAAVVATSASHHESLSVASRPSPGAARARTEELYTHYARTVGGLCRGLLRNRTEAEDATQQVFLSAHRALLNGSDPREPAAWLATIARNECWSRVSSRMREPLPSDDVDVDSALPDPLAEAIRRADLAALWRAIEELPRQQRDALLMREFGGLSYDELAVALAVTAPAVESLLFRARRELRTKLRTAYASISGVSWVDALLRLLSGSGAAAPIAAKVVALGVGAAAVTGGAIVAPDVLIAHHASGARPARHTKAVSLGFGPSAAFTPRTVSIVAARRDRRGGESGDSQPQTIESGGRDDSGGSISTVATRDGRDSSTSGGSTDSGSTTAVGGTDGRDSSSSGSGDSNSTTTTTTTTERQDGGATQTVTTVPVPTITVSTGDGSGLDGGSG